MINFGDIYQRPYAYVLGFHGTDKWVVDNVVDRQIEHLRISVDTTEWLGHGIYFWENDPERALDWAQNGKTKGLEKYDSVRALFPEGEPLYKESGFRKHNHVQICIVKPERCIKGYFRPLQSLSSSAIG